MELRHLKYFVAVAEALSFSRAAARLHVTQPALSRQIRDLEAELGCRLLLRGRNARTELTPEGRLLLRGAREILTAADKLAQQVRADGARLRVGHYGALWLDYFTPTLRKFARQHRLRLDPVELTPGELAAALRRGEVDVALIGLVDPAMRREFHTQLVATYPVQIALPADHPLAKRRKLRLADLREARWASWDERGFPGRKELLVAACRAAGFRPDIVLTTDSMASLFVHVATEGVVGHVIPMVRRMPHEGVVFAAVDPAGSFVSEMHAAWRRGEPGDAMIRQLVQEMAATRAR
jgi:DNA-binding transcriptional LysR family regulator